MKRVFARILSLSALSAVLGLGLAPAAIGQGHGLPPDEREQLRQQLRDAHRQRMLEHHRLTMPAATPPLPSRGGSHLNLSVEEREVLRHQLREQRRAARMQQHSQQKGQHPAESVQHRPLPGEGPR